MPVIEPKPVYPLSHLRRKSHTSDKDENDNNCHLLSVKILVGTSCTLFLIVLSLYGSGWEYELGVQHPGLKY